MSIRSGPVRAGAQPVEPIVDDKKHPEIRRGALRNVEPTPLRRWTLHARCSGSIRRPGDLRNLSGTPNSSVAFRPRRRRRGRPEPPGDVAGRSPTRRPSARRLAQMGLEPTGCGVGDQIPGKVRPVHPIVTAGDHHELLGLERRFVGLQGERRRSGLVGGGDDPPTRRRGGAARKREPVIGQPTPISSWCCASSRPTCAKWCFRAPSIRTRRLARAGCGPPIATRSCAIAASSALPCPRRGAAPPGW